VAQGVMAAHLLRLEIPSIRITETHPKALLWLIKIATTERGVSQVQMSDVKELIECDLELSCDHERDAALGSFAAWAMFVTQSGWRNLFLDERDPFVPVAPVEYWMPLAS
jgi:hypothetical protein